MGAPERNFFTTGVGAGCAAALDAERYLAAGQNADSIAAALVEGMLAD